MSEIKAFEKHLSFWLEKTFLTVYNLSVWGLMNSENNITQYSNFWGCDCSRSGVVFYYKDCP